MKIYNSQNLSSIKIFDILFWFLLAIIFPFSSGLITVMNCLNILVYIGATYFVADIILNKIKIINEIPSLIKTGFYIIFGSIICGISFLFIPSSIVLYALFLLFIALNIINKKFTLKSNSLYTALCIFPLLIMLFQTNELVYATGIRFCKADGDYFFYTAIVESLKSNHSFGNAIYHQGIGINYQALALMPSAQLAKFANLPSQIALWGVYSKIVPIVAFSVVAYSIIKMYQTLFSVKNSPIQFYLQLAFVCCMLMFFGPLHFLNFVKRDFTNTLLYGEGYVLPTGSPGFAVSMLFSSMVLLFITSILKPTWFQKLILISFLCIIIGSKLALFFPLAILVGSYSILQIFKKEYHWFYTLLIALPCCFLVYKLTLGNADSNVVMQLSKNGFYQGYLPELANKYHINGSNFKKIVVMFGITFFMWLSFKLVILLSSIIVFKNNNTKALNLIWATFISFCIATLPSFFLNVYGVDENGKYLFDGRFDMPQFIRADIFLVTIISIIFLLYFIFNYKNKMVSKIVFIIATFWMIFIGLSFYKTSFKKAKTSDQSWYIDTQKDFDKTKPHLMAMMGDNDYSGQTLVAAGVHPWYCTGLRNDGEGYTFTLTAHKRNKQFQQIFDSTISTQQKKMVIAEIKKIGVDYIVASPSNIQKINIALKDSLLTKIDGTKWFYKLN